MNNPKSINGLMRHLRDTGIDIAGSRDKRLLINSGYFHAYKGYRFFRSPSTKIPITNFSDLHQIIQYDSALKAILYPKIMFIETALKSIVLECILSGTNSERLSDAYKKAIIGYTYVLQNGGPIKDAKKAQQKCLSLQSHIQKSIEFAYSHNNPTVTHFYSGGTKHEEIPLWATFEILSMGDFGTLVSRLTDSIRRDISHELGIDISLDGTYSLVHKYIFLLKDMRNAIAHNHVVYDTRFNKYTPSSLCKSYIESKLHCTHVSFNNIHDYITLVVYFLYLLKIPKRENLAFINSIQRITKIYTTGLINDQIEGMTISRDFIPRMNTIKRYI